MYAPFLQDAVVSMYQTGKEVKQISQASTIPQSTIYHWLRKHNIVLRTTPNWSKYRKVARERNAAVFVLAKAIGDL